MKQNPMVDPIRCASLSVIDCRDMTHLPCVESLPHDSLVIKLLFSVRDLLDNVDIVAIAIGYHAERRNAITR